MFTDDLAIVGESVGQGQAMKSMIYMLGLAPNDPRAKHCNDGICLVAAHGRAPRAAVPPSKI